MRAAFGHAREPGCLDQVKRHALAQEMLRERVSPVRGEADFKVCLRIVRNPPRRQVPARCGTCLGCQRNPEIPRRFLAHIVQRLPRRFRLGLARVRGRNWHSDRLGKKFNGFPVTQIVEFAEKRDCVATLLAAKTVIEPFLVINMK